MDENFYKELLDNLYDGVYFLDRERIITYWNKGAERITGYAAEQALGKSCKDNLLNHVTESGALLCQEHCPMDATMNDGITREAHVYLHHANGHRVPVKIRAAPIRDKSGNIIGSVETFSSNQALVVSRRRVKQLQEVLLLDTLTDCGNRRYLDARLQAFLAEFKASKHTFGVLFCDVDHFKLTNDKYGHTVGDKVLRMVAQTLRVNIRETDTIGRWGGEEFLVFLHNVNETELQRTAEKLRALVEQSHLDIREEKLGVTISIGGTIVHKKDTTETLIERADSLMYQSKIKGRNQITIG